MASPPLLCWDIYIEGYHRKMRMLDSFQQLNNFSKRNAWKVEWDIEKHLLVEQKVILVTDLSVLIRFASQNINEMNGYEAAEVIGKSPKIFQGKNSSIQTQSEIREAIIKRIPFSGAIINYRKDGTPYNCMLEEYPVWNKKGHLVNFIAFEKVA